MLQILNANKKLVLLIGAVVIVYFFLGRIILNTIRPPDDNWPEETVSYRIEEINGPLELRWSRSSLFVLHKWSFHPPAMASSQGKVFVAGTVDQLEGQIEVLAFDGQNGSIVWRSDRFSPDAGLLATQDALYVGENGYGTIISYHLDTGQILWSKRIPGARSIRGFDVIDNAVYVISSAGVHFLQADTGEIIKTLDEAPSTEILQETMAQLMLIPPVQIKPEYFEGGVFFPSNLRFKDGVAIDRKTGERLWQVEGGTLSNVVTTQSAVYVLTFDRKFLALDPQNGAVITSVQFEPSEQTINATNAFAQAFYIAADEAMNTVYVFLGDSTQLFAFKIVD